MSNKEFPIAICFLVSIVCLVVGGIFGFSSGNCRCPETFDNSTVTRVNSSGSFSCLIVNNSTIINVSKICNKFDNYEVAIVFFVFGIFIIVAIILFILYNICDIPKCCRHRTKPPQIQQELRPIQRQFEKNDQYTDIQVV